MREEKRKTNDAMQALREARRAKWQSKVADAMESFQVAGIDATHDEMLQKIQEQTAVNEARMDMAMTNVDTQGMKIEEEAEKLRAQEMLKQFKQEMGMESPASEPAGGGKTLGKKGGGPEGEKAGRYVKDAIFMPQNPVGPGVGVVGAAPLPFAGPPRL